MSESTWESLSPDQRDASGKRYEQAPSLREITDEEYADAARMTGDEIAEWLDLMAEDLGKA